MNKITNELIQIFKASVSAVLPENLIRKSINYDRVSKSLMVAGELYSLRDKTLYMVGAGKAVQNMAREVEKIFANEIKESIISIPVGSLNQTNTENKNITYNEGAKDNLPDTSAETTAKRVKNLITKLTINDLLLVLISGGGSALLPLPKEPISLEEKTTLISKLAKSGADIIELNTVRKRISDIKGGKLAVKAQPATVITFILSDIVGDPQDLIASGPTTENKDHPLKAIEIIAKYKLNNTLPDSIKKVLSEPEDVTIFPSNNVKNHIIGSNKLSIDAALNEARTLGYLSARLSHTIVGNVKDIAKEYVKLTKLVCDYLQVLLDLDSFKSELDTIKIPDLNTNFLDHVSDVKNKKICMILGGETTVEVKGSGKGGRNQQLALEFSNQVNKVGDKFKNYDIHFLSAGTDGIDGPTYAAGAIGYKNLVTDAKKENLDVNIYLSNNDSYNFYKKFKNGDLHVITGHTNTNVMDIHLITIQSTLL